MINRHVKYLLIGAGLASSSAAAAIRRLDPAGEMLLVGQEINRPYHRPPLSKEYLLGQKTHEELFTLEAGWFVQNHVDLRTGRRAAQLDTGRHSVALNDGQEISYEKLLLATGASAQPLGIPGANLPNLFYLRSLDDVGRLNHAIDAALREGQSHRGGSTDRGIAVVIGGGFSGVELAANLRLRGLDVDLVLSRQHPWNRFAGENLGRLVARKLAQHQIQIHAQSRAARLEGDGRVQRVVLSSGEILPCDLVIAAVGMSVNKDLLRNTPLRAETAILVDDHCQSNVPDVYAAGDCAAVFDPLFGKHRVLDHWDNAVVTGTLAGTNMAGGNQAYDVVNHFFSDVFDLALNGWGEGRLVDHRIVRTLPGGEELIEFGIAADGRIAQVLAVGASHDPSTLRELVARRLRIDGNQEKLKDPAVSLQALLA